MEVPTTQTNNQNKIPLVSYYSETHQNLFERYFYPSYLEHLEKDFELLIMKGDQMCEGKYKCDNWNEQMLNRALYVNELIQSTTSEYLLFSDVDIIFFRNIKSDLLDEIKGVDLVIQSDCFGNLSNNYCAGFYFVRVNSRTKSFFNKMTEGYNVELDDQQNLNSYLTSDKSINYKPLPKKYYNFSHSNQGFWRSGMSIPFPSFPIVMFHANWTIGTNNKDYLLNEFKQDNLGVIT